jgi:mannose-6-phosphate isomerase-like protein (cupin superfamily)
VKTSIDEQLARLPGPVTAKWPEGEASVAALAHGSMTLKVFAPRAIDRQTAHAQDELYLVVSGSGAFEHGDTRDAFAPGSAFFVAAGVEHRFVDFSPDFVTWVVFWGPEGGEKG